MQWAQVDARPKLQIRSETSPERRATLLTFFLSAGGGSEMNILESAALVNDSRERPAIFDRGFRDNKASLLAHVHLVYTKAFTFGRLDVGLASDNRKGG